MSNPYQPPVGSHRQQEYLDSYYRRERWLRIMLACAWFSVLGVAIVFFVGWPEIKRFFEDSFGVLADDEGHIISGPGYTLTIGFVATFAAAGGISVLGIVASICVTIKGTWGSRLAVAPAFLMLGIFAFVSFTFLFEGLKYAP